MHTPSPLPGADWRLDLRLMGIGGAFDADRGVANTGALLEVWSGEALVTRVLIDCGHTCGRQLNALGLGYDDIDAVLITHAHGDHIDGLETLGYKSLFLHQRTCPVHAPQEVLDQVWACLSPKMGLLQTGLGVSNPVTMDTYFAPRPLEGDALLLAEGRLAARFFPVRHVAGMPAYGILLDLAPGAARGPVIRWSGDCTLQIDSPIFEDLQIDRGDRIFHDCLIFPYYEATVHTHYERLALLPEATREAIVLIHHGAVEEHPAPRDKMTLGQPLQVFTFYPR